MSSSRKDSLFSQASMKSLDIEESNKSNSHANAAHSVHHNHDHFFPEGALACYRFFEHDTSMERTSARHQIPVRIIGTFATRADPDESEIMIVVGELKSKPSGENEWAEGDSAKVKGRELIVLDSSEGQNWQFPELPSRVSTQNEHMDTWSKTAKVIKDNSVPGVSLEDIAGIHYPPTEANLAKNIWALWLVIKNDAFFYCSKPDVVACHPKEHMEQNFKAKEDAEVHELHAADEHVVKHKRSESLKEGRDRLLQMTMLRHSAFLKTLSDMQIKTLVNKAELLDIAKGAEVLRQEQENDKVYIMIAGECSILRTYGEGGDALTSEEGSLKAGDTFGEEALLGMSARMTVMSVKPCEIGTVQARAIETFVNNTNTAEAVKKVATGDHRPVLELLALRKSVFLSELNEQELRFIAKNMQLRTFQKDERVFRQSDEGSTMSLVVKGFVRIFNELPAGANGKEHVLETHQRTVGEYLDEACVVLNQPRSFTALVLSGTILAVIQARDVAALLMKVKPLVPAKKQRRASDSPCRKPHTGLNEVV